MILITSGCSFSECKSLVDTWPRHVERILAPQQVFHQGLGGQGNGMISRQIIWCVSQLLDQADDLLVGIMWSGPDRHEVLLPKHLQPMDIDYGMPVPGSPKKVYNPYNWLESKDADWLLLQHSSNISITKQYYSSIHNNLHARLLTAEHVLRVQWFLKLHKIKYFMTAFNENVFDPWTYSSPNVKYLYDQIDFDQFLPVSGEYEWCRDHSNLEFPVPGDKHPSSEQHHLFAQQVIVPFLQQKGFV